MPPYTAEQFYDLLAALQDGDVDLSIWQNIPGRPTEADLEAPTISIYRPKKKQPQEVSFDATLDTLVVDLEQEPGFVVSVNRLIVPHQAVANGAYEDIVLHWFDQHDAWGGWDVELYKWYHAMCFRLLREM